MGLNLPTTYYSHLVRFVTAMNVQIARHAWRRIGTWEVTKDQTPRHGWRGTAVNVQIARHDWRRIGTHEAVKDQTLCYGWLGMAVNNTP